MDWRTTIILPVFFVLAGVTAHASEEATPDHVPTAAQCAAGLVVQSRLDKADYAEFKEQLKGVKWLDMVGLAMRFIQKPSYARAFDRAVDLRRLFLIIAKTRGREQGLTWDFRTLWGTDRSIVLMGPGGYVLVLDREGRVFKGQLDVRIYHHWSPVWTANYSSLNIIPTMTLE